MLNPSEIYDVDPEVAAQVEARTVNGAGPVLVHAVRGFVDAGNAGQLAAEHLVDELPTTRLATFDVDQLLDYRSRRPVMTFDQTTWASYAEPELVVDLVQDAAGVPFLLLHGVEPDVQWERYVAAVRQIVERFDVPLTVGLHGIPMGIPHTRPLSVTAHATRPELVADHTSWFGTVQVPASASALLELRLGQSGHDAIGLRRARAALPRAVGVPAGEPGGADQRRACDRARPAGRGADVGRGRGHARRSTGRSTGSEEVAAVVHALEEQYDAFTRNIGRTSLLAGSTELPTADELGAEFERFLAQQGDDSGPA